MRLRSVLMATGLTLFSGMVTVSMAQDTAPGWYGGFGLGLSRLDPDTSGTTFRVDESQGSGYKIFLGYDLNESWAVEGHYADLGKAGLFPAGSVEYRDYGISGMYYFQRPQMDRNWATYLRAGLGSMDTKSSIPIDQRNSGQVILGGGVLLSFQKDWALRFDLDLYDTDSQLFSVGLVWNFANKQQMPEPEPEPVIESVAEPVPVIPPDTDNDGITDALDQCPDSVAGTKVDAQGCELMPTIVLEGVKFGSDSAELNEESRAVLNKVAANLMRYPELRVEVAGYTDSSGSQTANVALSQQRAEAVRDYLVEQGLAAEMFSARGYGPENPIADNGSVEGRAFNRRVELHLTEDDSPIPIEHDAVPEASDEVM